MRAARVVAIDCMMATWAMCSQLVAASADPLAQKSSFEPGRAERIQALHDPRLSGGITTTYSPGYEHHARELQRFISGELRFVHRELGVELDLSVAVLNEQQWGRVEHQVPYPTPSVTGVPPVALLAASWSAADHVFPKESEVSPAILRLVAEHGLTWLPAVHRAFDLVGGHELGHVVVDAYGIMPGTHWLNEMLASYVLYSYLKQERPDLLWLVAVLKEASRIDHPQDHTSLNDFESQYMIILTQDAASYAWYQAQFLSRIEQIYPRHGISFLKSVREVFPSDGAQLFAVGTTNTLGRLEEIEPGFSAWAASLAPLFPKQER